MLVGGRSSRMGQSKAALDFGGMPLLTRIVIELKWWFDEIVIVAAPKSEALPRIEIPGLKIVHDETAFAGPLDALRRGLNALDHGIAFACSCDLPMLNSDVAADLVAMIDDFDAVIPEVGGKLQPLHAVYRKRCANAIESLTAGGETAPDCQRQRNQCKKSRRRRSEKARSAAHQLLQRKHPRGLPSRPRTGGALEINPDFFPPPEGRGARGEVSPTSISGGARLTLHPRARPARSAAHS